MEGVAASFWHQRSGGGSCLFGGAAKGRGNMSARAYEQATKVEGVAVPSRE